MANIVNVDYKELFEMGEKFEKQGMDIKKLSEELNEAFVGLNNGWVGSDYDSYYTNSNKIVNSLQKEMVYLLTWSEFFTKYSYKYGGNVQEGLDRMKRIQQTLQDNVANLEEV